MDAKHTHINDWYQTSCTLFSNNAEFLLLKTPTPTTGCTPGFKGLAFIGKIDWMGPNQLVNIHGI